MRAVFVVGLAVTATARIAAAAPADGADADTGPSPWSLGMVGGVLQPLGSMKDSHERGLDAGVRFAWTSRLGLGVEAVIDYSPLPHAPTIDGGRFDTTYATAAIGPRFALGWSRFGVAVEAGGGVAVDHTTEQSAVLPTTQSSTTVAPAVEAGVEIELTVVQGGGIMLTGGGTRAFGALGYEYAWGMGGLALSF
jgi:hypothetical protein